MTETSRDPDTLARRLDANVPPGVQNAPFGDSDPLVNMAARLANAQHPEMSPAVMARIRSQVMEAQYRQQRKYGRRIRSVFHWAAMVSLIAVLFIFGLAPTALASAPGDSLYPYKQLIEWGELVAAGSSEAQAFTHLLHAERRAREAMLLSERGHISSGSFIASLTELAAAAEIARRDASLPAATLDQLEDRTAEINATLDSILHNVQQSAIVPQSTLSPLMTSVRAIQNGGSLLLPTATPTATPTWTNTPTVTVSPTSVPTQPAAGANLTAPTEAQASQENQVSGNGEEPGEEAIDCTNRPPSFAGAEGWRALCEGAAMPQDDPSDSGPPEGRGPPSGAGPPP